MSVSNSFQKFPTGRGSEPPTRLCFCLAILILRTASLTQDHVATHLRCGKATIVDVEKWFRELPFSQAEALCSDLSSIKSAQALVVESKSEEVLLTVDAIRVGTISGDAILRHYRGTDYLQHKGAKSHLSGYKETRHKREIRESAKALVAEIRVPWIINCFGVTPGKDRAIEVPVGVDPNLGEHLLTGGFSRVPPAINQWTRDIAECNRSCSELLLVVKRRLEKACEAVIPAQYSGQPGLTLDFAITACADAVAEAGGSPHFRDFPYRSENAGLRFGAFLVYHGPPGQDLAPYETIHRKLRVTCRKWKRTKEVAEQRGRLEKQAASITQQLGKFAAMEYVPGRCELCAPQPADDHEIKG